MFFYMNNATSYLVYKADHRNRSCFIQKISGYFVFFIGAVLLRSRGRVGVSKQKSTTFQLLEVGWVEIIISTIFQLLWVEPLVFFFLFVILKSYRMKFAITFCSFDKEAVL